MKNTEVVSLYKAIRDENGNSVGIGGIGILTVGLVDMLKALSLNGLSYAEYYLLNANAGEYIFNPDSEKIAAFRSGGNAQSPCGSV